MLQRFRPRLSFANVISMIALFAALGGGYAVAFSGSGTVQKGALRPLPGTLTEVRTLTGVGNITARCLGGSIEVYFNNESGKTLKIHGVGLGGLGATESWIVQSGAGSPDLYSDGTELDSIAHIAPVLADGGSKRPQLSIGISVSDTEVCSTSSVQVLALNTEE